MAKTARGLNTPEDKKRAGIIFMIFAVVIIAVGIYITVDYQKISRLCCAYVSGVITDVDSKRVRSGRKSHTDYRAVVALEDASALGTDTVISEWTRIHYRVGDYIKVYYNPDNPATYYVEGAGPEQGGSMIIMGIAFLAAGAVLFKKGADERKEIQQWSQ